MTIQVTNCQVCPFMKDEGLWYECNHPVFTLKPMAVEELPSDTVHPDCPLKKEPVTVELKKDT